MTWDIFRWIVFAPLALLSGAMLIANWHVVIEDYRRHRAGKSGPYVSPIPLIGGLSGVAAVLVLPVDGAWRYCWIPLVIDYGCLPAFAGALFLALRKRNES